LQYHEGISAKILRAVARKVEQDPEKFACGAGLEDYLSDYSVKARVVSAQTAPAGMNDA